MTKINETTEQVEQHYNKIITGVNYDMLPEHMRDCARLWVETGFIPGSFLKNIIINDFVFAARRADRINKERLFDYAVWLDTECPRDAWGNWENFKKWAAKGGLIGMRESAVIRHQLANKVYCVASPDQITGSKCPACGRKCN